MGFIPVFLEAADLRVMVIGGDEIAEERARMLVAAGARVTLVSPSVTPALEALVAQGRVDYQPREFRTGDLDGFALAYCTLNDERLTRAIAAEARAINVPLNVTDDPALCSFIVPAVVKRGALEVAISTSGASPALARMLREEIGESLGPEYETLVRILGAARPRLRELSADAATRSAIARELARGLRDALVRRDGEAAEQIVRRLLGVSLSALSGAPETRPAGSIIK